MARVSKNQSGVAVLEILLAVVAVALVLGVGFYIAHSTNKTTTTLNNANADSSQVVKPTKKTTTKSDSSSTMKMSDGSTMDSKDMSN